MVRAIHHAARALKNSPLFALTAIVTIGLGIGASAAIYSVAHAVILRPLPYQDPARLVIAQRDDLKRGVQDYPISTPDFLDLRNGSKDVFENLDAIEVLSGSFVLPDADGVPEQLHSNHVTPGFLRSLGAQIAIGRNFEDTDGEQQTSGRPVQIGILSYEYWRRRYGGDPSIVGKSIVDGAVQVVGVLAPGFELLLPPRQNVERAPDLWLASRLRYDNADRLSSHLYVLGRLKPEVTMERGQASADLVTAQLRKEFLIKETSGYQFRLVPLQAHLVAEVRPALTALMGAVVFLLLIACSNVANLLLVRASLRARDLAVRAALGAELWNLVEEIVAESFLLCALGSALGLGLAWVGLRELLAIAPGNVPRLDQVHMDSSVLGFTILAALLTVVLISLAPVVQASKADVITVLRFSGRGLKLSGGTLRNAVVIGEVALCFVLLAGSGLMFRSFLALRRTDPGFNPHGLLAVKLAGGRPPATPALRAALMHEVQTRLASVPGVRHVSGAIMLPLNGPFYPIRWGLPKDGNDVSSLLTAADNQISLPGYFEALGVRLLEGRTFTEDDNQPGRNLVVIDDLLAKKAYPSGSAIGQQLIVSAPGTSVGIPVEVIGVVAHQRQMSLAEEGHEELYFTNGHEGHGMLDQWAVRVDGDAATMAPAVRAEVGKMGRGLVVAQIQPMQALIDRAQAGPRFTLMLIAVFAAISTSLAAVGLYGVLSTSTRQRTAEIGMRMALGASPAGIMTLVAGQALRLSLAGIALGLLETWGLSRAAGNLIVGVESTDPLTLASMAVLFLAVAALASWIPAQRAARLDPSAALRE